MTQLSTDAKRSIIKQALNRGKTKISEIAAANNIGYSTLNRWLRSYKQGNLPGNKKGSSAPGKNSGSLTASEKFDHILATNGLSDVKLGKYCRQHGLYAHELEDWKNKLKSSEKSDDKSTALKAELTTLKAKNKKLESELKRKDKALAEASALLILKKKADLIWGESEAD